MARRRLTFDEMRAEGASDAYVCPRCGCADWRGGENSRVQKARHPVNSMETIRKRICRHCGQTGFRTIEVPVPEGMKLQIVPDDDEESEAA